MSLMLHHLKPYPEETARVVHASFPKGNPYLTLLDELGTIFEDEDFPDVFPKRGHPALSSWRSALVTVLQFREDLLTANM